MNHRPAWTLLGALAAAASFGNCKPTSPTDPAPDPQTPRTFSVTLEWTAPTMDAAGGALADLAGYRLYYRNSAPADGPGSASLDVVGGTRATVEGLAAGTWHFGVSALDESGNESDLSNQVFVEVGP